MDHAKTVSRYEANHLKNARKPPEAALTLEPGGSMAFRNAYDAERLRERRIAYIEQRLTIASACMNRDRSDSLSQKR
ncbi:MULTISPECIES: hypothetical protein [Hyphomonas]|uniref:hypothetical protein n=1 Tax=Hyphomonas TaxID=85 RepID=UPI0035177098